MFAFGLAVDASNRAGSLLAKHDLMMGLIGKHVSSFSKLLYWPPRVIQFPKSKSLLAFRIVRASAAKNEEASLGTRVSDLNATGLTTELLVVGAAVTISCTGPSNRTASGGHGGTDQEQGE